MFKGTLEIIGENGDVIASALFIEDTADKAMVDGVSGVMEAFEDILTEGKFQSVTVKCEKIPE